MNTNLSQLRRVQLRLPQFHPERSHNKVHINKSNGKKFQHKSKPATIAASFAGEAPTLEFAEKQVEIYEQIVKDTTQKDLLQRNITCYYVAVGILAMRAALLAFAQIEIMPNFGILLGFLGTQLQVGFSQLVLPTFGPPCLAAFVFLRWKFRHEMEAMYLGSFGKILETTQKAGFVHNAKVAWEKLLLSQWLLKYGLGWAIVAFLASLFVASQITNYFIADLSLTISNWLAQPCFGQTITVGFMVGMLNLWIASAFMGYVIMGDLINMGSYTILKVCMKFDKVGEKKEEVDDEEQENTLLDLFLVDREEVEQPPKQASQNGVGKNGISDLKVIDLDKEQFRNANKPQNQN